MLKVNAYSAAKYVIAARTNRGRYKLFQIVFSKKDGSIYVAFPYFRRGGGILGEQYLDASVSYPTDLIVGETFSVTTNYVKYSHHPSGRAHFSQDGKVKTKIKKQSVPLSFATGHIFTFMVQGIDRFDKIKSKDIGTRKRGVVEFPLENKTCEALKFVCFIYGEKELAKIILRSTGDNPWFTCIKPDGQKVYGILLATNFEHNSERRYLMLTVERIPRIIKEQEVFLSFMGGFDSPDIALDLNQKTSWLMFIYPSLTDTSELAKDSRCIDLQLQSNQC